MKRNMQNMSGNMKYLLSGFGKSGWDLLESYAYSLGLRADIFVLSFIRELSIRTYGGNLVLYIQNGKVFRNPSRIKKLIQRYGADRVKDVHLRIDDLYNDYSRYVIVSARSDGKSRPHLCYASSEGHGITFTHSAENNFHKTSYEHIWSSHVTIENILIQNISAQRSDLMRIYNSEFVRKELLSLYMYSILENKYPHIYSGFHRTYISHNNINAIGGSSISRMRILNILLNSKEHGIFSSNDLIHIAGISKKELGIIFASIYS